MKDYAENSYPLDVAGTFSKKCTLYANEDSNVTVTIETSDRVNYPPIIKVYDLERGEVLYNVGTITCNSGCVTCVV